MENNEKHTIDNIQEEDFSSEEIILRNYLLKKHCPMPNVEKELMVFHQTRKAGHRYWIYTIVSVAAVITLFFAIGGRYIFTTPESDIPVVAFWAQRTNKEISIQSSKGDIFVLSEETASAALSKKGICFNSQENSVNYCPVTNGTDEIHIVTTPSRKDFKLILNDGTEVWLNADSQLSYPLEFSGDNRVVRLRGEAYFKVNKDTKHPFMVITENLHTKVLGTEFNIRNYSHNDTHVTLLSGSIEIQNSLQTHCSRLLPGQDAFLMPDGSFLIKKVDTTSVSQWKNGYFYFDRESLCNIATELGRWYNVDVIFRNHRAMDVQLHFVASRKRSMKEAVDLLNSMKKAQISISNSQIIIE